MGRIPELMIAMLACAKIGAVHSVVYGGFSEQALADRIEDAQSKVLITCDGACVNQHWDNNNCGECGAICATGESLQHKGRVHSSRAHQAHEPHIGRILHT